MLAAVAALLALAAPAAAPDAPLGLRTQGTFRELFLDVTGADARAPGPREWDVRWSIANDWSTPTPLLRGAQRVELRTDEQADALTLAVRVPWAARGEEGPSPASRFSTTFEWRLTEHWGGYTDGGIEAWHRLGQYTNFERQRFPRDAIHVALRQPGGATLVALDSARLALGDVVARTQVLLAEGGVSRTGAPSRWGVSARVDVKLPTGPLDRLGGSGGLDVGAGVLGTAELTSWLTGHALLAASAWSGLPQGFALQPRAWHGTAELSLAAHVGRFAVVLEDRLLTPVFEGGWRADPSSGYELPSTGAFAGLRFHNQISLAVRQGPLTVWLSEDFTPGAWGGPSATWFYDSNAPDVVVGVGVRRPF